MPYAHFEGELAETLVCPKLPHVLHFLGTCACLLCIAYTKQGHVQKGTSAESPVERAPHVVFKNLCI